MPKTKSKGVPRTTRTKRTAEPDGAMFQSVTDGPSLEPVAAIPGGSVGPGGPRDLQKLLGITIPESARQDPIKWVEDQMALALPEAFLEKLWLLKFGNDTQRDKVAGEFMDRKGLTTKKDNGPAVQPAIVLIQAGSGSGSPWAQRVLPGGSVIDVESVGDKVPLSGEGKAK